MARRRVHRDDINCPICGSGRMRKDGFANGRQAYRCGDCGRRCIPGGAYNRPGPAVKARAVAMYAEGSSPTEIGRVLGYSAPAVPGRVKKAGRAAYPEPAAAGTESATDGGDGEAAGGATAR